MIDDLNYETRDMPQMHLFVDTNVFLSYYRHTGDNTQALDKLRAHLEAGSSSLHLPSQVKNEWLRNRERILLESTDAFQKGSLPGLPRHLDGLDSTKKYLEASDALTAARKQLLIEANAKALTFELAVDNSLSLVVDLALVYPEDDAIFKTATSRAEKGNPPGKKDSYGDQYNWEMLLARVPDEDLYVVSKDSDFASALAKPDKNGAIAPNDFLRREWAERKGKKSLYVFPTLALLLKFFEKTVAAPAAIDGAAAATLEPHTSAASGAVTSAEETLPPTITPTVEPTVAPEKVKEAVERLVGSVNFQQTHNAIGNLMTVRAALSTADAHKLAEAALDNKQVGWILSDSDVRDFYLWLLESFTQELEPGLFDALVEALGLTPDPEDDDPWADA